MTRLLRAHPSIDVEIDEGLLVAITWADRRERVEVCNHERPSIPSSLLTINPARRTGPGWELLI